MSDNTELFIRMADCPEIQEQCSYECEVEPELRDKIWWDSNGDRWFNVKGGRNIWLPRQDDIQGMLIPKPYRDFRNLLSFFFDWVDWNDDNGEFARYTSMEQLWLAYFMFEKHNKVWNDGWHEV